MYTFTSKCRLQLLWMTMEMFNTSTNAKCELFYIPNINLWFYVEFLSIRHPSIGIHRAQHDKISSNLQRHAQACTPANTDESRAMWNYAHSSQYNQERHRMKIALWIARRNRPFSIVKDEELLDIFYDLNSACITPKRRTVSRNIQQIFLLSREKLGALLQVCNVLYSSYLYLNSNDNIRPIPGSCTSAQMGGLLLTLSPSLERPSTGLWMVRWFRLSWTL